MVNTTREFVLTSLVVLAGYLLGAALSSPPSKGGDDDRARRAKVALALAAAPPAVSASNPCICGDSCKCKESGKVCPGQCPVWLTDYDAARTEAQKTKRPLFIVVGSPNCPPCNRLKSGPLKDAAVVKGLRGFVCLQLDGDKNPAVVKGLMVKSYPTVVVGTHDGAVKAFLEGYQDAEKLIDAMRIVKRVD